MFRIWGADLGPDRLLTFDGPIRAWVNGEPRAGRPAHDIVLSDRDQVVLVHGGDVEIHHSFAFKPVRL